MAIIDTSYFIGEFKIPNLGGGHPAAAVNTADVNWFIAKYEKEFLINIMGETMYDEFIAGLGVGSPAAKWTELRDQLCDSVNKVSPIAAYVWYSYRHNEVTQSGSFGETVAKTENSSLVSSSRKLIDAWNTAMRGAFSVSQWIEDRLSTYTTYENSQSVYSTINDFGI